MNWFIFPQAIVTFFISMNFHTSMTFESEVSTYIYGGQSSEVSITLANNKKTLIIKANKKPIDTTMSVFVKGIEYAFRVKYTDTINNQWHLHIFPAKINSIYKLITKNEDYSLMEGTNSLLLINNKKIPLIVNDEQVKTRTYLSKGAPVFINEKRIYN